MNGADIILSHIIGIRLFNMLYCNEERALFQNFTDQCRIKLINALTRENRHNVPFFRTLYKRTTKRVVATRFFKIREIGFNPPPQRAIISVITFNAAEKTPITTSSRQLKCLFFICYRRSKLLLPPYI